MPLGPPSSSSYRTALFLAPRPRLFRNWLNTAFTARSTTTQSRSTIFSTPKAATTANLQGAIGVGTTRVTEVAREIREAESHPKTIRIRTRTRKTSPPRIRISTPGNVVATTPTATPKMKSISLSQRRSMANPRNELWIPLALPIPLLTVKFSWNIDT